MVDDLDVVPVGVENERAVIIRMILRSRARRAVVFPTGSDGRASLLEMARTWERLADEQERATDLRKK